MSRVAYGLADASIEPWLSGSDGIGSFSFTYGPQGDTHVTIATRLRDDVLQPRGGGQAVPIEFFLRDFMAKATELLQVPAAQGPLASDHRMKWRDGTVVVDGESKPCHLLTMKAVALIVVELGDHFATVESVGFAPAVLALDRMDPLRVEQLIEDSGLFK